MNISEYGWTAEREAAFMRGRGTVPARIISVQRGLYGIVSEYGEGTARLKGGVYYNGMTDKFPTIGDFVEVAVTQGGEGQIVKTLERSSCFSRKDPYAGVGEQLVAANIDYVFLMMSMNQNFNLQRLQRYLTVAWQSGGTPVAVLTKADLVQDVQAWMDRVSRAAPGVDVLAVSAVTGFGLESLDRYLIPGKTVVFLGSSGIGKSSLLNVLAGGELMKTGEIRESDARGRHTTTNRQMFLLKSGALVIDTPGMRELGAWEVTEGMSETFGDLKLLSEQCRFSDCTHTTEPGCAVRAAIESGELSADKLKLYRQLERENAYAIRRERRRQILGSRAGRKPEKRQKHKNAARQQDW